MIDWQGLLKFTLQHSDGTRPTEFKQMSENDKKWLEQAMQHYSNSEIIRIQNILKELDNHNKLQQEHLISNLQELQQLLDQLDKGSTLYKMGGHIILLRIIFYSTIENARIIALQIYAAANQNDAKVQNQSINTGALEMIELLKKKQTMKIQQNLLSAVSATIRGQNLQAKRIFIRLQGLELLEKLIEHGSDRLKYKINVLWRDLLFYDDRLHYTFNDLSSFSNTGSLQPHKEDKKHDLSYDPNKQMIQKNELPSNKDFKGCVHRFLESKKQMFLGYLQWLKDRMKEENQTK